MVNKSLLKRLGKLGYPLFERDEEEDANLALAEVVQSKDIRLWGGFPLVLANSAGKGLFDYGALSAHLKKPSERSDLDSLVMMSLALYKALNIKFSWANRLYKGLGARSKKQSGNFLKKLKKNRDFKVAGRAMSSRRLKDAFNSYYNQASSMLKGLDSFEYELGLEYALSQVFSPKQKELFLKKLKGEKLTKTEKEYFSRAVKKKTQALANSELHRLSRRLLQAGG